MKPKPYRRVVEVPKANGWEYVRSSGSHRTFHKNGSITIVTVPYHGMNGLVKTGVLKSIARQSGIPESEF